MYIYFCSSSGYTYIFNNSVNSYSIYTFLLHKSKTIFFYFLLSPLADSTAENIWDFTFRWLFYALLKISSTSSYLNLTVTFSVLFDHYSFFLVSFFLVLIFILLNYPFILFSEVFVGGKILKSLQIQSLYLSPNLKAGLTDMESGFKITLAFFLAFEPCMVNLIPSCL